MDKLDLHTHSFFSQDGHAALADMLARAKTLGLKYYAISDHFDYDYDRFQIKVKGAPVKLINEEAYFALARDFQRKCEATGFNFLVGCELGFADDSECNARYRDMVRRFQPDFAINSVHSCLGEDCYASDYFKNKPMRYAYGSYLDAVRKSLDAPYPYDIVAHIGYVSRNAPYENKKLRYSDFASTLDDILKTIVAKNKILEVNTSARGADSEFLPDVDILTRYFELGGRNVSFASDAHATDRIAEKYDRAVASLKNIGFTHFTVPVRGKHETVAF